MKTACSGRHPDFLQRFLQVDDDLASVRKGQRNHAAGALIVNVYIAGIVDAVTSQLDGCQNSFCMVQIIKVGHYNPLMFFIHRIIAATFLVCVLSACGQKGPLFLTPQSVPYTILPSPAAAPLPTVPASAAK